MASGDFIFQDVVENVELTAPQRTALGNLVNQLWSGALADLDSVTFFRIGPGRIGASLIGDRTVAPGAVPNRALHIKGRVP